MAHWSWAPFSCSPPRRRRRLRTRRTGGHLYINADNGSRQGEAYGTAGWADSQPSVRALFRDYNALSDNDSVYVQVSFLKYQSWVCGVDGQLCYGYRVEATHNSTTTLGAGYDWRVDTVRLGHKAAGHWKVRIRTCDKDYATHARTCSHWSRYIQVD